MYPNFIEIKPSLTLQTFKSTEGTESKAEDIEPDEKSPSATSITERTLYRQKSRSFIGSEKGQEDVHKDSVQVKHLTFHNIQYILRFVGMLEEWPKSSFYRTVNMALLCLFFIRCWRWYRYCELVKFSMFSLYLGGKGPRSVILQSTESE